MKAATYTKTGTKATSETTLDKAIFEATPKDSTLLAQVYEAERVNSRTVNARVKTRGEVRGGGRKPWRQKGTGRARAGSIRSPIWRGGGITFGPTGIGKSATMSQKSRQLALKQALSLAAKSNAVTVVNELPSSGKTKDVATLLEKANLDRGVLLVLENDNEMIKRAVNNIQGASTTTASRLSAGSVLDATHVVFESKALKSLTERLGVKA